MARSSGNVRIGPISFITLISVLLLAVMAVLCVTTANASRIMTERHAASVTETYEVDSAGQAFVANIDAALIGKRSANGSTSQSAVQAVEALVPSLSQMSAAAIAATGADDLTITAQTASNYITFQVVATDGHTLSATVKIDDYLGYSVTEWKMSLPQEQQGETLWSGSSAN